MVMVQLPFQKQYKWESSEDHQVFLQDTELDDLCEAEIRALQDLAVSKLNKMDFNIPANLVKGQTCVYVYHCG